MHLILPMVDRARSREQPAGWLCPACGAEAAEMPGSKGTHFWLGPMEAKLEDCPCRRAGCGFVEIEGVDPSCPHHGHVPMALVTAMHPQRGCPAGRYRPAPA